MGYFAKFICNKVMIDHMNLVADELGIYTSE